MKNYQIMMLPALFLLILLPPMLVMASASAEMVTLKYTDASQFEISTPSSPTIYVDVTDPSIVKKNLTENDILVVTHTHPDHFDRDFGQSFPGTSIIAQEGTTEFDSGMIFSIPSSHTEHPEQALSPSNASNYIMVVDIGGLRIAHFGDIGQKQLTDEQISRLGKVDIAITQFVNPLSQMDLKNLKAFSLMRSLSPALVIPTAHGRYSMEMLNIAKDLWPVYTYDGIALLMNRQNLPQQTTLLVWGADASFIAADLGIPEWQAGQ